MRDHVPGFGDHGGTLREELKTMAEKVLMKGNEALAEAAIQAGCHHFFGYPHHTANRACGLYGKAYAEDRRYIFAG